MKQFISLLIIALVTLSSCLGRVEQVSSGKDIVQLGQQLPLFTVTLNDHTTLNTAQLQGRPSVIVFFNTLCSDCRRELPIVQRVYDQYGQRVQFLCISRAQTDDEVSIFWQKNVLTMPYSAQSDKSVYELFATSTIPRIYVSDASGMVCRYFVERMSQSELTEVLDSLLNKYSYK